VPQGHVPREITKRPGAVPLDALLQSIRLNTNFRLSIIHPQLIHTLPPTPTALLLLSHQCYSPQRYLPHTSITPLRTAPRPIPSPNNLAFAARLTVCTPGTVLINPPHIGRSAAPPQTAQIHFNLVFLGNRSLQRQPASSSVLWIFALTIFSDRFLQAGCSRSRLVWGSSTVDQATGMASI